MYAIDLYPLRIAILEGISNIATFCLENAWLFFLVFAPITLYLLLCSTNRKMAFKFLILTSIFFSMTLYFFISGQVVPPLHMLQFHIYGLGDVNSSDIHYLQTSLNLYSKPGRGTISFRFGLNEAANNSMIRLSVPKSITITNCNIYPGGQCESKSPSESRTMLYFSDNSRLDKGDYDASIGFTLEDNITPKLFISLQVHGKNMSEDAPHMGVVFNPFDYSSDYEFSQSNLDYPWLDEQQRYTQIALKHLRQGGDMDYIWTRINVKDRRKELISQLLLAIIAGLIVAFFIELGIELRHEEEGGIGVGEEPEQINESEDMGGIERTHKETPPHRIREKNLTPRFEKALSALGEATVSEVREWMNVNDPRKDKDAWKSDMIILGDFATYPDGKAVNNTPSKQRPFLKTTKKGKRPAKFKSR